MTADAHDEVNERFVEYRATGSRRLRDELVEEHVGLAEYLARRFADRGEAFDDLRQVALVGLLKAVERFEPDRGLRFSTFATPTIVGELKRHFRDRGWQIRVPRRLQEVQLETARATDELTQSLGRSPTIQELAAHLGTDQDEILEAYEAARAYRPDSLSAPVVDDSDETLVDRIGADDPEYELVEFRESVAPLLANLPPRQQRVISLRFYGNLTQSEIAAKVGVSQMQVSRLLSDAFRRLRADLTG